MRKLERLYDNWQYWQRLVNYSLYIKALPNHSILVARRDWYRTAYYKQYSIVFQ